MVFEETIGFISSIMVNCIIQVNISMQNKIQVNLNTPFPQKTKKRIILSLISVIIIILSVILYFMSSSMNQVKTHQEENKQNQTSKNAQANIEFSKMTEKDIKSSKDRVNVYVFWGDGCPHCKHLAQFFDSNKSKLKDKMNLYAFEVWKNSTNLKFMKDFGKFLGETPQGVPYMIIGNKTFSGFAESDEKTKDEIINLIKQGYQNSSKIDKYQEYKAAKQ